MSEFQDAVAQKIWECYAVETGRSMPEGMADRIAAELVKALGGEQEYAPADREHDGYINPDTQWTFDRYEDAAERAEHFTQPVATRYVTKWRWADRQPAPWAGSADLT